jgi:hypothetical protein
MMSGARWLLLGFLLTGCGSMRSSVAGCPNWEAALRRAERIADCDADHRGNPDSKCQRALKRCKGGCDICQFLGTSDGLTAYVADKGKWAPIKRVPMSSQALNGYDGTRAQQHGGLFRRSYELNWYLCNKDDFVDVLGETIVHEAMHECIAMSPPGILDWTYKPPPGCSAEELENACVGK